MKPLALAAGILSGVLAATTGLAAQLGSIAKKEAERRKTVQSGKVYTNDSLPAAPEPASAPATSGSSSTAAPAASSSPAADKSPTDKSATEKAATDTTDKAAPPKQVSADPAERKKDEAAWRERMKNAREALDRAKSFADALQIKINSLNTDFVNRDDPVQRAAIAAERDKSLAEMDRLKKEIAERTKAIASIQEDARRAGVPAGWVR